ncbi:MAG TPA: hypothetical protein VKT82_06275 [Ktedonobacterales bacterium]|nr:hypothetical protein [Ktedonobacterales bacterium]
MKQKQPAARHGQPAKPHQKAQPLEALTDEQLNQIVGGLGGSTTLPPITNNAVVQSFPEGDIQHPVVIGNIWNGKSHP